LSRIVRYFEDLQPGTVLELGEVEVSEAEILEFARRYDPQPFHLDPVAGRESVFGGLCASGWHTAAMQMRLLVDGLLSPEASLGSPGIDQIRWLKPVFPGDRLRLRVTISEATPSRSKPFMGSVVQHAEMLNQHGQVVMSLKAIGLFRRRPDGTVAATAAPPTTNR
jgi:acyl dehydratase